MRSNRFSRLVILAIAGGLFVANLLMTTNSADASVTASYNFNTTGDLNANFNNYVQSGTVDQSATGGIGNTGAISTHDAAANAVFASKSTYSIGPVGSTYEFSSFVKSVGGNGYSGMGFTTLTPSASNASGLPFRPNDALGLSVHGGGFVLHNGSNQDVGGSWGGGGTGITTIKASSTGDLLGTGSPDQWYKIVFKLTRNTSTTFNARIEVWPSGADGTLITPAEADAIFEWRNVANANLINAPSISSYINFSNDRVYYFDNYSVSVAGGASVIAAGAPVVLTSSTTSSAGVASFTGNVTNDGGTAVTDRGFVYASTSGPTINDFKVSAGTGTGTFSATSPQLANGTYYIRAYATNAGGTSYGSENTIVVDEATAGSPSAISASSITFKPGNQSLLVKWTAPNDNGSAITDYLIQYSNDAGVNDAWHSFTDSTSTDPQIEITGLTNPTPGSATLGYFVRVRAVNSVGNSAWTTSATSATPVPGQNGNRAIIGDPGCVANSLARNDDNSVGNVSLGFDVNWYGTTYNKVAYNNNGGIKFDSSSWGQYSGLNLADVNNDPLIVALFNDLDTRQSSTTIGTFGPLTYPINGHQGYCFNWVNYGDYSNGAPSKSAQLILLSKANNDVDLMMNYNWLASGSRTIITGWAAPGGQGYIFQNPIPESESSAQQGTGPGTLVEEKNIPTNYVSHDSKGRYIFELQGGSVQGAPGAPTAPLNVGYSGVGNGAVTLDWDAPSSNGGSAITNYTIQFSLDGVTGWTNFNHSASTNTNIRVTGLTNGTPYYFRVTPFSNVSGDASSVVGPIIPVAAPENSVAPSFTGTQSYGQVLTAQEGTWSDGGNPITGTTYQWQVSLNCTGTYTNITGATSSTYTIDRKALGGCVRLAVTVANANGSNVAYSSETSRIISVSPGAPLAPGLASTNSGELSLSWLAPSNDGGADISEYNLQYSTDGVTWLDYSPNPTGTRVKLTGLTDGANYYVRIRANNGQVGAWSEAAGPFVPQAPAAPAVKKKTRIYVNLLTSPTSGLINSLPLTSVTTEKIPSVIGNTVDPTKPITVTTGEILVGQPGNAIMLINGVPTQIQLTTVSQTELQATSNDGISFTVNLKEGASSGAKVIDGSLVVQPGHALAISGQGFEANTEVTIWLFSEPKKLASLPVDGNGNISADVAIANGIPVGKHTLQVSGFHPDGTTRSVSLAVEVPAKAGAEDGRNLLVTLTMMTGAGALLALMYFFLFGRRKRKSEEASSSFRDFM